MPLDPADPDRHLWFMIRDSVLLVIVAHLPTAGRLAPALRQAKVLWIERDDAVAADSATKPAAELGGAGSRLRDLYLGADGVSPRRDGWAPFGGAMVFNSGLWCRGGDEVVLQLAHIASEALNFEVWGPLLTGGRLAMLPPGSAARDNLGRAIQRDGVTTLRLDSGAFNLIAEKRPDHLRLLRRLVVEGNPISPFHVQAVLDAMWDGEIIKVYGHTETTTVACWHRITSGEEIDGTVPIGQPTSNTSIHLLDAEMKPVPSGSTGELWVGGDGLAQGYLNHPGLTRQKFIANPFSAQPGRGFVLERATWVVTGLMARSSSLAVSTIGSISPGDGSNPARSRRPSAGIPMCGRRLWSAARGRAATSGWWPTSSWCAGMISADELTDYLGRLLPRYMIPSVFVRIDALPLSRDGRVDRSTLPPLELIEHVPASYPTPISA